LQQDLTTKLQNSGLLQIHERLRQISGGEVLDIGTGCGEFVGVLMKSLRDYDSFVGIDISEKDLQIAEADYQGKPVKFEIMDASAMSFNDCAFDTVSLSFLLHHLEKMEIALEEAKRVLKPGGYLIIQEVISDQDQNEAKLNDRAIHHLKASVDRLNGIPHSETYSRQQLRNIIGQLQLSRVEVFESTDPLNCLFCKRMKECEDPRSENNIRHGLDEIDDILKHTTDLSIIQDIQQEAEHLKERVRATGYESASQLFFICRK
jgi:ubiquinone/menaquinone biosynthesis C-methylase UbiE